MSYLITNCHFEEESVKYFAIIVAGGSGERMISDVPKQFLELKGTPILMKSIQAFSRFNAEMEIIVVLPEHQKELWVHLCQKHHFHIKHQVVSGGVTRYHSVKNALQRIGPDGVVGVHDGVRPLVSETTLQRVFEMATMHGNAVPYIDIVESIRFVEKEENRPVDRNMYKLIQTPQAFDCKSILKAYEQKFDPLFTDDASVVEKAGIKINLVPGNRENIKITTQADLKLVEALSGYLLE